MLEEEDLIKETISKRVQGIFDSLGPVLRVKSGRRVERFLVKTGQKHGVSRATIDFAIKIAQFTGFSAGPNRLIIPKIDD